MRSLLRAALLSASLFLAACATRTPTPPAPPPAPAPVPVPAPTPPPAPVVENALRAGVVLAAPASLDAAQSERVLQAFRLSCPSLVKRPDSSGLTKGEDWRQLCSDAASLLPGQAQAFFRDRFEWARVGDGKAFATGYYEPEMRGSRTRIPGYDTPVYSTPTDLTRCTRPDGATGRGRIDETGTCILYHDRAAIEDGALAGRGLEIAWVDDPVDLFVLHIQGSGRLRLPDGNVMRIGYDNQNGREYVGIGRLLRERNILPAGGATMQDITAWIRANPAEGRALMRENLSYIFFKELTGPGPLGALGLPVTARVSVAADPKFVPLGAPVFLAMERPEASGLWIAQDTGGAIKGANRFDTFWGAGEEATRIAGGMSAKGQALLLLPKGTVARAQAQP